MNDKSSSPPSVHVLAIEIKSCCEISWLIKHRVDRLQLYEKYLHVQIFLAQRGNNSFIIEEKKKKKQ